MYDDNEGLVVGGGVTLTALLLPLMVAETYGNVNVGSVFLMMWIYLLVVVVMILIFWDDSIHFCDILIFFFSIFFF